MSNVTLRPIYGVKMTASKEIKGARVDLKSAKRDDFMWSKDAEPHAVRRRLILSKYPGVKALMGPCHRTKWIVLATVVFQVAMAYWVRNWSWPYLLLAAYVVGGTLNHMMTLAIHELSHNLAFKTIAYNKYLAYFANLPIGVPSATAFKRYHLEHHKYQGEDIVDVDIPTSLEGRIFQSSPGKLVWLFFQAVFYAVRPLVTNPKKPGKGEFINLALCLSFDVAIVYFFGGRSMAYLLAGTLLGLGVHPVAGHFIGEHYVFGGVQETYSYYGVLNYVTFNVGYHSEHHDFPNIPGSRLYLLKAMAPDFYDHLPCYTSWCKVLWDFVMCPDITPFSRIKRSTLSATQRTDLTAQELASQF